MAEMIGGATGGAPAPVFDGKLTCVHDFNTEIKDNTEVLFIKPTGNITISNDGLTLKAMALDMARKLYESNSFDSFPEKTPEQFAVDAINRVKTFFEVAKKKGLIDGDISDIF